MPYVIACELLLRPDACFIFFAESTKREKHAVLQYQAEIFPRAHVL